MHSRKKVEADPIWKYEELPPTALIESLHLEPTTVDPYEFSRAEWFWSRRPKVLSESLSFLFPLFNRCRLPFLSGSGHHLVPPSLVDCGGKLRLDRLYLSQPVEK
jgi:hypothetical protein